MGLFFEIVYGDDEAARLYHSEYNKTPEVIDGHWDNCTRDVRFSIPVKAPAIIRRVIGRRWKALARENKCRYLWLASVAFDCLPKQPS